MAASKGRQDARRMAWYLDHVELADRENDLDGVSAKEVFNELRTNQDFRKGIDWNPRLGADVFLLYGCGPCKISPLRSEDFYRAVTVSPYGRANVDLSQPGFHDDGKAHWRTPCCAKKVDVER